MNEMKPEEMTYEEIKDLESWLIEHSAKVVVYKVLTTQHISRNFASWRLFAYCPVQDSCWYLFARDLEGAERG